MNKSACLFTALVLASLPQVPAQTPAPAFPPLSAEAAAANVALLASEDPTAAIPKRDTGAFLRRHEGFVKRAKEGPVGLLFLGDSITDGWNRQPHIWEHYYGKYAPANFGIGGDRTQHVIWRIENGELEGIHPRVTVLMLGTNNSGDNTADQIFAANKKIIETVRRKIPQSKVLVLAIFPRGPRQTAAGTPEPWEQRMAVINEVNRRLATLDDGRNVRFLNLNARFLADDGRIPSIIMPDQLHPNGAGYQLWAEAMQPLLEEMMGKEPAPRNAR
jgi:lysophospholipase L1-like esterase